MATATSSSTYGSRTDGYTGERSRPALRSVGEAWIGRLSDGRLGRRHHNIAQRLYGPLRRVGQNPVRLGAAKTMKRIYGIRRISHLIHSIPISIYIYQRRTACESTGGSPSWFTGCIALGKGWTLKCIAKAFRDLKV